MTLNKVRPPARFPHLVAHRGASGHAPENTSLAFSLALQMQAESIELDVQMSADGVPVIFHDSAVDRTTNRKGKVGDFSAAELGRMDAGSWFNLAFPEKARSAYPGLGVPTLQEIVDLLENSSAGLYVELKDPELQGPDFESRVLDLIRLNHFEERVIICSFSGDSLQKIRSLDSAIKIAVLAGNRGDHLIPFAHAVASGLLSLRHNLITRSVVAQAHEEKLSIAAWTVNDEEEMERLINIGVDSIITNYPDRLYRLKFRGHQ